MGLLFRWVWGGKAHDRKRTWNGGPEIMEWSEDYSSRQRKSGNALWRPYFQSRYVTSMRGTSPKCATAYIISRSIKLLKETHLLLFLCEFVHHPWWWKHQNHLLTSNNSMIKNILITWDSFLQISSFLDSKWPTYLLKYCHLQQEKCYLVWDLCQSYSKHKKEKL